MTEQREIDIRRKLKNDFRYYALKALKIRTKAGAIKPFELNKPQEFLHEIAERQLKEKGKVRLNILKGRQEGISTYVEGRFYWKTTHRRGVRAFILTHEEDATKNLFEMAERFHENVNPLVKPSTGAANAKELHFDLLDSGYRVGTARTKGTGRSSTIQYFHGSEVAFWPNAAEHAKGVFQAIPDEGETEVFRESTANGMGNYFHEQWKLAEHGKGEYWNVFIPWFWMTEYRKPLEDDFSITHDEIDLKEQYELDDQQINWRRQKIIDLSANGADGEAAFKQEYPMNAAEAFQLTGKLGLIKPKWVTRARKAKVSAIGPLVAGVDPSRGGDRFSIALRKGRKVLSVDSHTGEAVASLGQAVSLCKKVLDTEYDGEKVSKMFIDAGGGAEITDRLVELGYGKRVKAIAFGSSPIDIEDPPKYLNRRGEMWGKCNEWLTDENLEVEIPDSDSLQADLCASPYRRDTHDRIVLWPKEKILEEYGFSPDEGDAVVLTFAEPVQEDKSADDPYKHWQDYG
jgi:hypothetical protein